MNAATASGRLERRKAVAARNAIGTIGDGPRFVTVRIAHEATPRALPARDGSWIKTRFRTHLGFGPK